MRPNPAAAASVSIGAPRSTSVSAAAFLPNTSAVITGDVQLPSPVGVMDAIEQHKVTMTVMVPTMVGMLLNHEAFQPERMTSLRKLTYGASPMPAALLDRLLAAFPELDIYQGYGMTEASAVLTVLGPAHLGVLCSLGLTEVPAYPRARVGVIPLPFEGWAELPDILPFLGAGRVKLAVWSSAGDIQQQDSAAFDHLLTHEL